MSTEEVTLDTRQGTYKEYDPQFTAEISKKMQMPDRLMAVNGFYDDSNGPFASKYAMKNRLDLPLAQLPYDEPHYILSTPPSSITNFAGTTLVDDDSLDYELERFKKNLYNSPEHATKRSPRSRQEGANMEDEDEGYEMSSIPMTPGTMLLMQNGDNVSALQRQIGKLNHRVGKLQEENRCRKNRELVFYPLVVGYLIIQLGRFLLFKSH